MPVPYTRRDHGARNLAISEEKKKGNIIQQGGKLYPKKISLFCLVSV